MPSYKLINDNGEYRFNNLNEIKNEPFFNDIISLNYNSCNLTSFSFEGCPKTLQKIDLDNNELTSFSWEGTHTLENLQKIYLYNNQITEILHGHLKPPNVKVYGLPIIKKLIDWSKFIVSNQECVICHESEDNVISLNCHPLHTFHANCLISWFNSSGTEELCPLCKSKIT